MFKLTHLCNCIAIHIQKKQNTCFFALGALSLHPNKCSIIYIHYYMQIKTIIKAHGLTQADVAARMGVSRIALVQQINGNPTVGSLRKMAEAIGCKVSDFFDDEESGQTDAISLDGETAEIGGVRYRLTKVEDDEPEKRRK